MTKTTDNLLKPNLIFSILKNGLQSFSYVQLGDNLEKLFKLYGEPEHDAEIGELGYCHYDHGLRFSYRDNQIDEIIIDFKMSDVRYPIKLDKSDFNIAYIDENIKIHDFLLLLNEKEISWTSESSPNNTFFDIVTEGGIHVLFDLEEGGSLYRIVAIAPDEWGWYDLKYDLAELIIPKLEAYKKGFDTDGVCIPNWVLPENERPKTYTEEDEDRLREVWLKELDHMLLAFRGLLDFELGINYDYMQQGFDKFAKYFQHFWD